MDGMNGIKASAVVLSYRRPRNVEQIVAGLLEHPFVNDIVVWHNGDGKNADAAWLSWWVRFRHW